MNTLIKYCSYLVLFFILSLNYGFSQESFDDQFYVNYGKTMSDHVTVHIRTSLDGRAPVYTDLTDYNYTQDNDWEYYCDYYGYPSDPGWIKMWCETSYEYTLTKTIYFSSVPDKAEFYFSSNDWSAKEGLGD